MNKQKIQEDMIVALKRKDQIRLEVLRFLISEIKYAEIEKKTVLTEEEVITVLQKELKKREEALKLMEKSGNTQILKKEQQQIDIIKTYLPKALPDEEVEKIIDEIITQNPNMKNPGPIIGQVMLKLKGQVEGSHVAKIISQKLQNKTSS